MESVAPGSAPLEADGDERSHRYLEVLGSAADTFMREPDFATALERVARFVSTSGRHSLVIYRGGAGSMGSRGDAAPHAAERYLAIVVETREVLAVLEHADAGAGCALLLVPIVGRDATWGVLQFSRDAALGAFDRIDIAFARDLAKLAAIALDNTQLAHEAGVAFDELRFLAGVGETMVESLDLGTRLDRFLAAVVPRLADWATVNLLEDDGSIETVAIAHRDAAHAATLERLRGPYYGNVETNQGTPVALRTGRSRLLAGVDEAFLRRHIRPETFDDIRSLGADSAFTVPLIAHGRVYGTLAAMRTEAERPFGERDIRLIEELARRAAVAIANAKLFERSATIADAFQHVQLPQRLPRVPGLAFFAFYAAGRAEATIGGDWYDAFVRPDGTVVLSIGDVAGSGLRAAVQMGSVRQLVRGVAHVQADPARILDAVDRALQSEYPEAIVTAFVGCLDPQTRILAYASAGHPAPLVRARDGTLTELTAPGLPLGLRAAQPSAGGRVTLAGESLLLLYTDGLTESTRDVLAGERRVRAALVEPAVADAADPARALHDAVLEEGARDDVALLAVRIGQVSPR